MLSLWVVAVAKSAQILKNMRLPFPNLRFIVGQTNRLKKRSEKRFQFSKTAENIFKLFFRAAIPIPYDDIRSQRSPTQAGHQRVWDGDMGDVLRSRL